MQARDPSSGRVALGALPALVLLAVLPAAFAQEVPFLVKDLDTATRDADPGGLTVSGGSLFFTVGSDGLDGPFGGELWKTDGTAAGTVLVKDILAGPQGSGPRELTDVNGTLFFTAASGSFGQLWRTDGTAAGTVSLGGGLGQDQVTRVGSSVFFAAFDFASCTELWTSDGTPGGTVLVKDINPGCVCPGPEEPCAGQSLPTNLTDVNGTLFFTADDGTNGTELWMSDGTPAGTVLVKDINPGAGGSFPMHLVDVNGVLFFAASDPVNGNELWMSDGTPLGTVLVEDINPGAASSAPRALHDVGSSVFFTATEPATGRELWTSDGTAVGTVLVRDINPGAGDSAPPVTSPPSDPIIDVGGTLFFQASDGTNGHELWTSDGSGAGTALVTDINPGAGSADIFHLTAVGGTVFFRAFQPATGTELWRSDGTAAGTTRVTDSNPGAGFANPDDLTSLGGVLFFTTFESATGRELWRSDGTAAGTTLVRDINGDTHDAGVVRLTAVGDTFFFQAPHPLHGEELWKSDGTAAGTVLVKDIFPGSVGAFSELLCSAGCREMVGLDGVLLFTALGQGSGIELWRSDGTAAGTTLVRDIAPGGASSRPAGLTVLGGTLYFAATEPGMGRELWKSDGTAAGTVLVKDINPGAADSAPFHLAVANGTLLFGAADPAAGAELWRSDGSAAGTVRVKDISPGVGDSIPSDITEVNGRAFFAAGEPATGGELWQTDGTEAGTSLVADILPGTGSSSPHKLTAVDGRLFFVASEFTHGTEVWTSDGTPAGTILLKDINPGLGGGFGIAEPDELSSFGGALFFRAFEPSTQNELWTSDGTPAGTVLVRDIYPGSIGSLPRELTVIGDTLYFTAGDPTAGVELWKSDGTGPGTVRLADIAPGVRDAEPRELTVVGGRLFFTAFSPPTGRELWGLAGCGNGVVEPGEACDDGSTIGGDCCSAACELEVGACDDGNVCTDGDACAGASCVPGTATCATVLGRALRVRDPQPGLERRHRVTIVAREAGSPDTISGDPTADGAILQVIANGATPTAQTFVLPPGPAWRPLAGNGFAYTDRAGANGAVAVLVLQRTPAGVLTLKAKLRGANGPLAIRPPDPGTDGGLRLRLGNGGGYCVLFGGAAGGRVRNREAREFEVAGPSSEAGCP